ALEGAGRADEGPDARLLSPHLGREEAEGTGPLGSEDEAPRREGRAWLAEVPDPRLGRVGLDRITRVGPENASLRALVRDREDLRLPPVRVGGGHPRTSARFVVLDSSYGQSSSNTEQPSDGHSVETQQMTHHPKMQMLMQKLTSIVNPRADARNRSTGT